MSEKFVASNGVGVDLNGKGQLNVRHFIADGAEYYEGWRNSAIPKEVIALREFFLHERDTELGRWRWPEKPEYVVYPQPGGAVNVLRESLVDETGPGVEEGIGREKANGWRSEAAGNFFAAARAFFAAHPEPKPAWHDAKPGEVWVITTSNVADEVALVVTNTSKFRYNDGVCIPVTYEPIETGRRIFPEVVSDDA